MKALQFVGDNKYVVNELPVPEIGDDELLLASRSVGICHSDIELLGGRYIIPFDFPVIPGHEWSAEVVRVGRAVKGLEPGDRVVGECVIGSDHFGFSISGTASRTTCPGRRAPSSSRSAAVTTRPCAPTTWTPATRFSCWAPARSVWVSWRRRLE